MVGASFACTACPDGTFTEANATGSVPYYSCSACPLEGQIWSATTNKCECPASTTAKVLFCVNSTDYNTLLASYNVDTADTVNYRNVESGTTIVLGSDKTSPSDTFTTLQPKALYECLKYKTDKQC